jgi:hypothetical protein
MGCRNPAVEVRAAAMVIEKAVSGVELIDLATRVEELERALRPEPGRGAVRVGQPGHRGWVVSLRERLARSSWSRPGPVSRWEVWGGAGVEITYDPAAGPPELPPGGPHKLIVGGPAGMADLI